MTSAMSTVSFTFSNILWIFCAIAWSSYVYVQELEKKTQFVNGHRRVKSYLKLKSILNLLVPSLVRDKVRSTNHHFLMEEGEVTMIFIEIKHFDLIV